MPLYKEWISNTNSLAAIWKIEEDEEFFVSKSGYSSDIKHDRKRLEHVAGRMLLKHLKEDFPILDIAPDIHAKPRLANKQYHFSISHSFPYIAAIISPEDEKGIDIQCWRPKMDILQHKFLSPEEQQFPKNDETLITVAWTAKEAAYKQIGRRGIDFIEQLPIKSWNSFSNAGEIGIHPIIDQKTSQLLVNYIVEEDFSCAYL